METETTHRVVIVDRLGVPRVWGEGPTKEVAEARAWDEVNRKYRNRRDLLPFTLQDAWGDE